MNSDRDDSPCDQSAQVCTYAMQTLPACEMASVEAHVASCSQCQRELAALRPVVDGFVACPTDLLRPSASLQERLARRIAAETGGEAIVPPRPVVGAGVERSCTGNFVQVDGDRHGEAPCEHAGAAPLRAMVQGQGSALRMEAAPFRRLLADNTALQSALNRYVYVLMSQLATSSACTRFHRVGPRLARWLLMSHDRVHADTFRLTHEFPAFMLGVRRVGITEAASELQQLGLVRYQRGVIHVLNRAGLEKAACSCYAADRGAYDRMFG